MIRTHSPLKSWEFLRFWDIYPKVLRKAIDVDVGPPYGSIFPHKKDLFKALELTPFEKVKCVILGQDPYHTKGMAMGLSFSVYPHVKRLPPSLRNILSEYASDLGHPFPKSGDLTPWTQEGVLLLNTILTVEEGKPLSHANLGWEKLAYEVIRALDDKGRVVFHLWGKTAQDFKGAIRNCPVVMLPHPSPFSAHTGFLGSKPFSLTNELLKEIGEKPIDWKLR